MLLHFVHAAEQMQPGSVQFKSGGLHPHQMFSVEFAQMLATNELAAHDTCASPMVMCVYAACATIKCSLINVCSSNVQLCSRNVCATVGVKCVPQGLQVTHVAPCVHTRSNPSTRY